ncbi:MAG: acetone carboxylase subunit gamma [Pseudomonadota bacterium]
MSSRPVSPTVEQSAGGWLCRACGQDLGPSDAPWKAGAMRRETPLAEAGAAWATGQEGVVLRHFVCPGCARLLDTETAMADDPPLHDRV